MDKILEELDKPPYSWMWKEFDWCNLRESICIDGGWDLREWGIKFDVKVDFAYGKSLRVISRLFPLYFHAQWWGTEE